MEPRQSDPTPAAAATPERPGPDRAAVNRGIVLLVIATFVAEQLLPGAVAVGGLYILPVLLSLWLGRRRWTVGVATTCTLLTLLGLGLGVEGDLLPAIVNRAAAVFVVWVTAVLGVMRIRIERELERSRQTTATTLRSIADAVITTGAEGRVTFLNAAAEELTGWTAAEALGQPIERVFRRAAAAGGSPGEREPPPAEAPDTLPSAGELLLVTREGRSVPVEASTAPIRMPMGDGGKRPAPGRVLVFRDIAERERYRRAIEELAYRDSLTGLHNRNSFLDRLGLELAHARRDGRPLALLFLDLDGFKAVNDELGHQAGDRLLVLVAQRLRDGLREGDTVARLGGDEFTVVLPRLGSARDARHVAAKLVERLSEPYDLEGRAILAPPSVGVALFPDDATTQTELLQHADQAMYRAKDLGGGRVVEWTPEAAARRASLPAANERRVR